MGTVIVQTTAQPQGMGLMQKALGDFVWAGLCKIAIFGLMAHASPVPRGPSIDLPHQQLSKTTALYQRRGVPGRRGQSSGL